MDFAFAILPTKKTLTTVIPVHVHSAIKCIKKCNFGNLYYLLKQSILEETCLVGSEENKIQ